MDMQALVNALNKSGELERSKYHMTLGSMIAALEGMDGDAPVFFNTNDCTVGPCEAHSYRGYYSDLAFKKGPRTTVEAFLKDCRDSLGETFQGYKGGDFVMHNDTPLWCAEYGSCGPAIVSTEMRDGGLCLIIKEVD